MNIDNVNVFISGVVKSGDVMTAMSVILTFNGSVSKFVVLIDGG